MNSMLMRGLMIGLTALSGSLALSAQVVVSSGFEQLDRWASECLAERSMTLGYPGNNDIRLEEFYRWYTGKPALIPLASAVIILRHRQPLRTLHHNPRRLRQSVNLRHLLSERQHAHDKLLTIRNRATQILVAYENGRR